MEDHPIRRVRLVQRHDYRFDNCFGEGLPLLASDEPAPLGRGEGPDPVQLLAAAVGNCLAGSLLFALRKYKQLPEPISVELAASVARNPAGRLRVSGIHVRLMLGVPRESLQHLERVLATFEEFCTVAESVRPAIPVEVEVVDALGNRLK